MLAMGAAGGAWLSTLSTLNVAAQTSVHDWVRARALSLYGLVLFGALALGSSGWGALAEIVGLELCFLVAAALAFLALLDERRSLRLREGAFSWRVMRDLEDDELFVERFEVPSWAEHLRQHARTTLDDRELQERIEALLEGQKPRVRHRLSVRQRT
jgi:MFS family permease